VSSRRCLPSTSMASIRPTANVSSIVLARQARSRDAPAASPGAERSLTRATCADDTDAAAPIGARCATPAATAATAIAAATCFAHRERPCITALLHRLVLHRLEPTAADRTGHGSRIAHAACRPAAAAHLLRQVLGRDPRLAGSTSRRGWTSTRARSSAGACGDLEAPAGRRRDLTSGRGPTLERVLV
jgi:hypothetical protein